MTTQIHIVNSSDSNPQQHARVTFQRRFPAYEDKPEHVEETGIALAPGESKAFWIGPSDTITVTEVFEPKPR